MYHINKAKNKILLFGFVRVFDRSEKLIKGMIDSTKRLVRHENELN